MLPANHVGEPDESNVSPGQQPANFGHENVAPTLIGSVCSECRLTKISLLEGGCWTCRDCHGKQHKLKTDLARYRLQVSEIQRQNTDQADELKLLKVQLRGSQEEREILQTKLESLKHQVAFLSRWDLKRTSSRGDLRLKAVDGSIVEVHEFILVSTLRGRVPVPEVQFCGHQITPGVVQCAHGLIHY